MELRSSDTLLDCFSSNSDGSLELIGSITKDIGGMNGDGIEEGDSERHDVDGGSVHDAWNEGEALITVASPSRSLLGGHPFDRHDNIT